MKTLMRVFLVVMALAVLSGISVGDASAQWTPGYNYYGFSANGAVSGYAAGPTDYNRNSLGWGSLGWNADQKYGIGMSGGVGPSSSGYIGIKIPGMQQYNLKWW